MSNNNSLKNKINDWLIEEGFTVAQRKVPKTDFVLQITDLMGKGGHVTVAKNEGQERLVVYVGIGLADPKFKLRYSKYKKQEKLDFLADFKMDLLKMGFDYGFRPQQNHLDNLDGVTLSLTAYIEGLTKPQFMDVVNRVKLGGFYVLTLISKKFGSGGLPESSSPGVG